MKVTSGASDITAMGTFVVIFECIPSSILRTSMLTEN